MKSHQNDAHYLGKVTIHYVLHPLHGRDFLVSRRYGTGATLRFELQADDYLLVVPAWMTDADRCRQLTAGDEPRVSMNALLQLASLLKAKDL